MNHSTTTEIYTLSLHDALPIWLLFDHQNLIALGNQLAGEVEADFAAADDDDIHNAHPSAQQRVFQQLRPDKVDRKSTRLNSSHSSISYAVFCLKKKKSINTINI